MSRIVSVVLFLISGSGLIAQPMTGKNAMIHIQPVKNFDVTGRGTDSAWNNTGWIQLSRIKGTSAYDTRVKLLYSDKGIYALYRCEDRKITATLREDFVSLWREDEDVIEIFFWTHEDFPIYLEYELSPLNYEVVILVPNLNGEASGWTPWNYKGEKKTRKATHIIRDEQGNPTAWLGEFFIPYALLRPLQNVPPKKGTRWRANIYRIDYDEQESSYWSWQPIDESFHEFEKYGTFVFD
jgi:hypothetical protein